MTTMDLRYLVERTLTIGASRETVFRYFTETAQWASWWGAGSTIDARAGGRLVIRYPNAVEAVGTVEAVEPPSRVVFTMGYPGGKPFPPGASRVTITLEAVPEGTRLHLHHGVADAGAREEFVQGWRYQLSLFANLVLDTEYADGAARVDRWFGALSEPEAAARAQRVGQLAAPGLAYRDRYSAVTGAAELLAQVDAMHRFMPGFRVVRTGEVSHRQGAVLTGWVQEGPGGTPAGAGSAVIEFDGAGLVRSVTMFGG
jgi:uncharacterized protein YndB with AHSA1/START domain